MLVFWSVVVFPRPLVLQVSWLVCWFGQATRRGLHVFTSSPALLKTAELLVMEAASCKRVARQPCLPWQGACGPATEKLETVKGRGSVETGRQRPC